MITRLGQLQPEEMGVIRLSPAYASSTFDRIANEVHANYVLEGGVRQSGKRVAITAQLIQVSDQTQVWGESYERDLQDVLSIQAEVASAIAGGSSAGSSGESRGLSRVSGRALLLEQAHRRRLLESDHAVQTVD